MKWLPKYVASFPMDGAPAQKKFAFQLRQLKAKQIGEFLRYPEKAGIWQKLDQGTMDQIGCRSPKDAITIVCMIAIKALLNPDPKWWMSHKGDAPEQLLLPAIDRVISDLTRKPLSIT